MIKKSFLIFIFLCAPFLIKATHAQNADSIFQSRNYNLVALEFERTIAFSSDKAQMNDARYKKALCYKNLGNYAKAQAELLKISFWDLSNDLKQKYEYETILCCYLAGNFTESLFHIEQAGLSDSVYKSSAMLLKALNLNETGQWNKGLEAAIAYVQLKYNKTTSDSLTMVLNNCYTRKNLPHIKSEKTANVLKFVPGLEQIYTGDILEGIFSFSINLAFLSFGAYEIYEHYYFTGYFVGAIGLSKAYFGGQTRANFLLNKKNYKEQRNFCNNIKSILLK